MTLCLPCSEGDAVCQPDESAGLGHRRHGRAALRAAGGTAGPGKLGGEEVGLGFVLGSRRDRSLCAPVLVAQSIRVHSSANLWFLIVRVSVQSAVPCPVGCCERIMPQYRSQVGLWLSSRVICVCI